MALSNTLSVNETICILLMPNYELKSMRLRILRTLKSEYC